MRRHFETPVLKILVGENEIPFNVNEDILRAISFFAKHGHPTWNANAPENRDQERGRNVTTMTDNSQIEALVSPAISEGPISERNFDIVDLTNDKADYVLRGHHFYTREAFAIFVRSLNEAPLLKPKDTEECRTLFQAYALGQQYDNERL